MNKDEKQLPRQTKKIIRGWMKEHFDPEKLFISEYMPALEKYCYEETLLRWKRLPKKNIRDLVQS